MAGTLQTVLSYPGFCEEIPDAGGNNGGTNLVAVNRLADCGPPYGFSETSPDKYPNPLELAYSTGQDGFWDQVVGSVSCCTSELKWITIDPFGLCSAPSTNLVSRGQR